MAPMSAIEDDLEAIFSQRDFGTIARIYPTAGRVADIEVIFDDEDVPTDNAVSDYISDVYVKSVRFECATNCLDNLAVNDRVDIENVTRYVSLITSDGKGTSVVHLSKEEL